MPTVESLTPSMLWTTFYGVIALCLLFLIGYRVYDAISKIVDRKKSKKEREEPDFAEKVSQKVIEKLEPRFAEIERNLEKDKRRLEMHETAIDGIIQSQKGLHDGVVVMCKFMLVLSSYGNLGSNEKVKEATADLTKYLAEQM